MTAVFPNPMMSFQTSPLRQSVTPSAQRYFSHLSWDSFPLFSHPFSIPAGDLPLPPKLSKYCNAPGLSSRSSSFYIHSLGDLM